MQRKYTYRPLHRRFWAKVQRGKPEECWMWTGGRIKSGYGMIADSSPAGKQYLYAHRVSYEFVNGPIPDGLLVMHSCDNPSCVNPAHLSLGTTADNSRDMIQKGRGWQPTVHAIETIRRGEKHASAKLSDAQVIEIRQRYATGLVTQRMLAQEFGVSSSLISVIVTGRWWKHLPVYPMPARGRRRV